MKKMSTDELIQARLPDLFLDGLESITLKI